jgi:hypothetical protein
MRWRKFEYKTEAASVCGAIVLLMVLLVICGASYEPYGGFVIVRKEVSVSGAMSSLGMGSTEYRFYYNENPYGFAVVNQSVYEKYEIHSFYP